MINDQPNAQNKAFWMQPVLHVRELIPLYTKPEILKQPERLN
jgi:hypothetical protein